MLQKSKKTILILLGIAAAILLSSLAAPSAQGEDVATGGKEKKGGRIINGTPANPSEWPFFASISAGNPYPYTRDRHPYCGGSLVAPRWVLTAGHCFVYWRGEKFFSTTERADLLVNSGQTIRGDRVFLHPRFAGKRSNNAPPYDAALLRLSKAASATPVSISDTVPAVGSTVRVAGFGITDLQNNTLSTTLLTTDNERISNDMCRNLSAPGTWFFFRSQFCSKTTNQSGPCYGDSGGPLMQGGQLVGLVSSGDPYCRKNNRADFYSKGAAVEPWVRNTIKNSTSRTSINWIDGDRVGKRRFELLLQLNAVTTAARVQFNRRVCLGEKCYKRGRNFSLARLPGIEGPGYQAFFRWHRQPFRLRESRCTKAKITARFQNGDLRIKKKRICA